MRAVSAPITTPLIYGRFGRGFALSTMVQVHFRVSLSIIFLRLLSLVLENVLRKRQCKLLLVPLSIGRFGQA